MNQESYEQERLLSFSTYGNSASKGIVQTSVTFSIFIVIISLIAIYDGFTIREVIDEIGIFLLFTTSAGLFAYQHKAIITRDTNSFTVIFLKQFTPLIVYSRKELDIKKLRLKQSKISKSTDGGSRYYEYTTKIYHNGSEIFSCKEHKSEFKEIIPELFENFEEIKEAKGLD